MTDDQIREYLRSRSDGAPPADLLSSISQSVSAEAQDRRSWFASFVPAAAGLGLTAAVIVGAIVLTQSPDVGPPAGSAAPSIASPDPSVVSRPSPTPVPSPSADAIGDLTTEGVTVRFEPVDSRGSWGSGELTRGRDITRYAGFETRGTYLLEIFVRYDAERIPEPAQFGASDWTLRPVDTEVTYYFTVEPINSRSELEPWPGPEPRLGQYPGAVDVLSTPTEGWIVFQVDARTVDYTLELVYQPAGGSAPATTFIVRMPGAPDPVAGETPSPQPGDPVYVDRPGLPFSVLASEDADALFAAPDTCRNSEAGYEVTFPDDWYTNTAFADEAACTWFTPDFFTVNASGEADPPVWISLRVLDGAYGYVGATETYSWEEISVDGRPATRSEYNSSPMLDPNHRSYDYVVALGDGPQEFGPTFVATISSDVAAEYQLAKAVLDRIMASLHFDE